MDIAKKSRNQLLQSKSHLLSTHEGVFIKIALSRSFVFVGRGVRAIGPARVARSALAFTVHRRSRRSMRAARKRSRGIATAAQRITTIATISSGATLIECDTGAKFNPDGSRCRTVRPRSSWASVGLAR